MLDSQAEKELARTEAEAERVVQARNMAELEAQVALLLKQTNKEVRTSLCTRCWERSLAHGKLPVCRGGPSASKTVCTGAEANSHLPTGKTAAFPKKK